MVVPLVVLAGLTVVGGLLNLPFEGLKFLAVWLAPVLEGVEEIHVDSFGLGFALSTVAVVLGAAGIAFAYRVYSRATGDDPLRARLGGVADFLERGWRFDWLYETVIVKPGRRALEVASTRFDLGIVDGAVNGIARAFQLGGEESRKVQSGYVRRYAFAVFAGTTLLVLVVLSRASFG